MRASKNRVVQGSHIIRRRKKYSYSARQRKVSSGIFAGPEQRGRFVRGEPSWSHDCTMPVCTGNDYRPKSFPQPSLRLSAFIACLYFL